MRQLFLLPAVRMTRRLASLLTSAHLHAKCNTDSTIASYPVAYLLVMFRGRWPQTPGIYRFGPETWQEDQATRQACGVAHVPGPRRRSGCFPAAPYPPSRHLEGTEQGGSWQEEGILPAHLAWKSSRGLWKARLLRGRWFNARTQDRSCWGLTWVKSVPLGRYWRKRPLVFSFVPRSQAW